MEKISTNSATAASAPIRCQKQEAAHITMGIHGNKPTPVNSIDENLSAEFHNTQ